MVKREMAKARKARIAHKIRPFSQLKVCPGKMSTQHTTTTHTSRTPVKTENFDESDAQLGRISPFHISILGCFSLGDHRANTLVGPLSGAKEEWAERQFENCTAKQLCC